MSVEDFSEALRKRRTEGQSATPQDGRQEIRLAEEHFNAIVLGCAALLRDRIYLRGLGPFAVVRAADAAGALTAKEIALAIMQQKGFDASDERTVRLVETRVFSVLTRREGSLIEKVVYGPRSTAGRVR